MTIELNYHSHPKPSHHHQKALMVWLKNTTDGTCVRTRSLMNTATNEDIPCSCRYLDIGQIPGINDGVFLYTEILQGQGWKYEERIEVTLTEHTRTSNLFYSYWTFDEETLLVMFKLVWHNWTTWEEVELLDEYPELFRD